MTAGRRTKLTPKVQAQIVDFIERGFTLDAAAHHAGIVRQTMFYWMRRGEKNKESEFFSFFNAVRAALETRKEVRIKINARPLARARYEYNKSPEEIAAEFADKIVEAARNGRVPWAAAVAAATDAEERFRDLQAVDGLDDLESTTEMDYE